MATARSATLAVAVLALLSGASRGVENDPCVALVTDGDKQVGLLAYQDNTCSNGGLGCFMNMCRFCKYNVTASSQDYVDCPWSNSAFESAVAANCASYASSGDQGVGISAFYDDACQTGGLGCFGTQRCRYCKKTETAQSKIFVACPSTTSAPSKTTSPPATSVPASCDQAVATSKLTGISYVTDARCKASSLSVVGCVGGTNCLLCRNSKNEDNQYLTTCKILQDQMSLVTSSTLLAQSNDVQSTPIEQAKQDDMSVTILVEAIVGVSLVGVGALLVAIMWKKLPAMEPPGDFSVRASDLDLDRHESMTFEEHDNAVDDELRIKEGSIVQVYTTEEHGSFGV